MASQSDIVAYLDAQIKAHKDAEMRRESKEAGRKAEAAKYAALQRKK